MMKHEQLKLKALSDPDIKAEYDALEPGFTLLREMLSAREKTGLSQEEIAVRMGTVAPAVTRLESSLAGGKSSPSFMKKPGISPVFVFKGDKPQKQWQEKKENCNQTLWFL